MILRRIRRSLDYGDELIKEGARFYVKTEDVENSVERLKRIFGIASVSPAIICDLELEKIFENCERLLEYLMDKERIRTFGIFIDKNLSDSISSTQLKIELGDHLRKKYNLKVDLKNPDAPIRLDIRQNFVLIYAEKITAAGGLPLGTQDAVVSLLSGGPDSTLATWLVMHRGSYVTGIYFDFGEEELRKEAKNRVLTVAEILASKWRGLNKLYIIPFGEVISSILTFATPKNAYVILKRYMVRAAEIIAEKEKAKAIVTGEIIGEHASQTVHNLSIITEVAEKFTILRPVLAFDKSEVFRRLKEIDLDLYNAANKSIEPCKVITSIKATTLAKRGEILEDEKNIDLEKEDIERIVSRADVIDFKEKEKST